VTPHAWALDALLAVTIPGRGLADVTTEVLVLVAMAAGLLGASLVVFHRRALSTT
jgi:ABC-2 type transport system permease protein